MRRFTHKQVPKKPARLLIPGISTVLVFCIFLSFQLGIFNIKKIEINIAGSLNCATANQLKEVSKLSGKSLFFVNLPEVSKNIKEKFICVRVINFHKFFPGEIKLEVFGRESIASLTLLKKDATQSANLENTATPSAEFSQNSYLVDNEVIFEKTTSTAVPVIYLSKADLAVGKKIDVLVQKSLNVLEKMKVFGFKIQNTQIEDRYFIIFPSDSQPRVIFNLDKDTAPQIASLQLILKIAKIDSSKVEFVDLRFDKPIIKIAPKKNG